LNPDHGVLVSHTPEVLDLSGNFVCSKPCIRLVVLEVEFGKCFKGKKDLVALFEERILLDI